VKCCVIDNGSSLKLFNVSYSMFVSHFWDSVYLLLVDKVDKLLLIMGSSYSVNDLGKCYWNFLHVVI